MPGSHAPAGSIDQKRGAFISSVLSFKMKLSLSLSHLKIFSLFINIPLPPGFSLHRQKSDILILAYLVVQRESVIIIFSMSSPALRGEKYSRV